AEGPDVELVENGAAQRQAAPTVVGPAERGVVDDGGEPVDAVGLRGRARVRPHRPPVEPVPVARSGAGGLDRGAPPPCLGPSHRDGAILEQELAGAGLRRPAADLLRHASPRASTATGNEANSEPTGCSPC